MMLSRLIRHTPKSNVVQWVARLLLGAGLIFAGLSHLTIAREEFQAQVPNWVPLDKDVVVVLSGIAELILGISLVVLNRYRALVGWVTGVFFIVIFPGNISQYVNRIDAFQLNTDQARLIRLFFQPVLVVYALWSTTAWQAWMNARANGSDVREQHRTTNE